MAFDSKSIKQPVTVWTIAIGVFIGIQLSHIADAITTYIYLKVEMDPAMKRLWDSALSQATPTAYDEHPSPLPRPVQPGRH